MIVGHNVLILGCAGSVAGPQPATHTGASYSTQVNSDAGLFRSRMLPHWLATALHGSDPVYWTPDKLCEFFELHQALERLQGIQESGAIAHMDQEEADALLQRNRRCCF